MLVSVIKQACCQIGGTVVFLQSYGYKKKVLNYIIENNVQLNKPIFAEEEGNTSTFQQYSKAINTSGTALLLCVIGGRLSEGINFKDNLCRQLIVAGLPYANNQSLEIKERMAFWDKNDIQTFKGRDFYDNMCIKLVNQAVGRAIRHIDDYAYIILLDQRYKGNMSQKLPSWIRKSLNNNTDKIESEEKLRASMEVFFQKKR